MEITNVPATKVQQAEKLAENIQKWMGQSGSTCSMCSKGSGFGCVPEGKRGPFTALSAKV